MKIIEVVVSPNGKSKIETKGFAGAECREASRFIEEALGAITSEQLTVEFHQQHSPQHQTQQRA
ncbi:MAG: DUF2997 domain-containing protein [Pseudomonas sp.]|uniref:DUF2997 domain-containing protein n=1 Tax=Pseudomonas sp. TaxID=306 RepID=UPI003C78EDE3